MSSTDEQLAQNGLTRNDLRRAVLQRLDTFTERIEWVGESADYAFADSIIDFAEWFAGVYPAPAEVSR